jgi:hypothetical protein
MSTDCNFSKAFFIGNIIFLGINCYYYFKNKPNIKQYVNNLSSSDFNKLMRRISKRAIVPNWYTAESIEMLLGDDVEVDEIMFKRIIGMYPSLNESTDIAFRRWLESKFDFDYYDSDRDE